MLACEFFETSGNSRRLAHNALRREASWRTFPAGEALAEIMVVAAPRLERGGGRKLQYSR